VETFIFWLLVSLGPSLAALAWLIWYSGDQIDQGHDDRRRWTSESRLANWDSSQ
jgi:hypothetical protein